MKGQSLNIDWMIGFTLIIVAIISATIIVTESSQSNDDEIALNQKAQELTQNLIQATEVDARKTPLYINAPAETGKIPVDRKYNFSGAGQSAIMEIPSEIDETNNDFVTVVDASENSYEMTYFFEEYGTPEYENSIETGNWMNNSHISVLPGGTGLDSLRIDGFEVLNNNADLGSSDTSITEGELYASTLNNNLKIYNDSRELILNNTAATFDLKNFTTLYWEADDSTTDLVGTGSFKSGNTQGLTVARNSGTDYGITFTGDLNADVSKPDSSTVRVEVDSPRTRIYLHQSDYTEGKERIEFHRDGNIYFGAEEKTEGSSSKKIENLENPAITAFQARFELQNYGYNVSYDSLQRGSTIPFENVIVNSRKIALLGKQGNFSSTNIRVALWN